MSIVAAQVRLPWGTSSVRGPLSSNTWHFDTGVVAPDLSIATVIGTALGNFYGVDLTGIWSSMLSGDSEIAMYNLDDPKPRLPFGSGPGPAVTTEANTLPGENSVKVQARYPRSTGVPTQRGRGTLHLGPISSDCIGADGLLTDATMDLVEAALGELIGTINPSQCTLVVGSETHGFQDVEAFIISNEMGTVRRRQFPATDRRVIAV